MLFRSAAGIGKTSLSNAIEPHIPSNFKIFNPDTFNPEDDPERPNIAKNSKIIRTKAIPQAINNKESFVYDTTGQNFDETFNIIKSAQDNGYKVYLGGVVDGVRYEGSQIISPTDSEISRDIAAVAPLPTLPRRQGWKVLDESHVDAYIEATSRLATKPGTLKVVYSAMHGVGTETLQIGRAHV